MREIPGFAYHDGVVISCGGECNVCHAPIQRGQPHYASVRTQLGFFAGRMVCSERCIVLWQIQGAQ